MKSLNKPEVNVTLKPERCSVHFSDGTLLTVTVDGAISFKNAETSFAYEPSRLKKNQTSLESLDETVFTSKTINLREGFFFNIRVEKTERLRVDVFFSEADEAGTLVSGCFITKEATSANDWAVSFVNSDRFLINLSEVLVTE
jgi:hypothetical protein